MEKEKKPGERQRGTQNTACASATMPEGAQEGSSSLVSRPQALQPGFPRAIRRAQSCDTERAMAAQNPSSSSHGATRGLLHIPQRSQSTPRTDPPQRAPLKKGGSAAASKAAAPTKGPLTEGRAAPKPQPTQPRRELGSEQDPARSQRHRVQLLSLMQGIPMRLAWTPQKGFQVCLESLDRERRAAIWHHMECLRRSMGGSRLSQAATGVPGISRTSTTPAVGWAPPGAPDAALSRQPASAAAQAAGPRGTASGWPPESSESDAGPKRKTSGQFQHGKDSTGGKVPKKRRVQGRSSGEERQSAEPTGGSTSAVVTPHTVRNSGGTAVTTQLTEGGKVGMSHTSFHAETRKGPAIMPATASLQALRGDPQHPQASGHKKGPSTKGKRTSGFPTRKKSKDPSSGGAPSKSNGVSLDSSGVPSSSQYQTSVGNSAPTECQGSPATVFLGGRSASSQHDSAAAQASGETGTATTSAGTVSAQADSDAAYGAHVGKDFQATPSDRDPEKEGTITAPAGIPSFGISLAEVDPDRPKASGETAVSPVPTPGHRQRSSGSQTVSQDHSSSPRTEETGHSAPPQVVSGAQSGMQAGDPASHHASPRTAHSSTTLNGGPSSTSGLPSLDSTEAPDARGSFIDQTVPTGDTWTSILATLTAAVAGIGPGSASVWAPASATTVTAPLDATAASSLQGQRDCLQDPYISKTPGPSGSDKDSSVCSTTSKGISLGVNKDSSAHVGDPTVDETPSVVSPVTDTQSGGTPVSTVPCDDSKAGVLPASSAPKTREVAATVSASTNLQALRSCDSDQKECMTEATSEHTSKAPGEGKRRGPKCDSATIKKKKVSCDSLGGPAISQFQATVSPQVTPTGLQGSSTAIPREVPPASSAALATGPPDSASGWVPASTKRVTASSYAPVTATSLQAPKSSHQDPKVGKTAGPSGTHKDPCGGSAGKKKRVPPSRGAPSGVKGDSREPSLCPTLLHAPHLQTPVLATTAGVSTVTTVSSGGTKAGTTSTSATADKKGTAAVPANTSLQALSGSHSDPDMCVRQATGKHPLGGPAERKRRGPKCEGAVIKKFKGTSASSGASISWQTRLPEGRAAPTGIRACPSTVADSSRATYTPVQASGSTVTASTSVVTAATSPPSAGSRRECDRSTLVTMQQRVRQLHSTPQGTVAQGHSATALDRSGAPGKRNPRVLISDRDASGRQKIATASSGMSPVPGSLRVWPFSGAILCRRPAPYSLPCPHSRQSSPTESFSNRMQVARRGHPNHKGREMPCQSTTVISTSEAFGQKVPTAHTSAHKPSSRGRTRSVSGGNSPFPDHPRTDPPSSATLSGRTAAASLASAGTNVLSELVSLLRSLQAQQQGRATQETGMPPCLSTTAQSGSGALGKKGPQAHSSVSRPSSTGTARTVSGGNPPCPGSLRTDPPSSATLSGRIAASSLASAGTSVQRELVSLLRSLQAQQHGRPLEKETKAPAHSTEALSISGATEGTSQSVTTSESAALNARQSTTVPAVAPIFPAALPGAPKSTATASTQTIITIHPRAGTTGESDVQTLITGLKDFSF